MSEIGDVWIGADPGGQGNFGLAIVRGNGSTGAWCVSCADEAIDLVREHLKFGRPKGAGVDAPLWWSSGRSGERQADQWLRTNFKLSGGQVQTANSLRGAALVQGAMFVHRLRNLVPKIPVTETHPKALLKAMNLSGPSFFQRFSIASDEETEHQRDAVVSAVAAREGFSGRWKIDLASKRGASEQDPQQYWLAPIHYYWPEE